MLSFSTIAKQWSRLWRQGWEVALVVVLCAYIGLGVAQVPLHGDEATILYTGRDVYYLLAGEWDRVVYHPEPDSLYPAGATQQELRLLNGTLARYAYGLVAWLTGYPLHDINEQWDWGADWDYNHNNSHVPSEALLWLGRSVSALMTIGAALAIYATARMAGGRWAGLLALAYFALNPAVLINGRRAMMEGAMLLFSQLTVVAGLMAWRRNRPVDYALFGLASGLAIASKHTAVVVVVAVGGALALQGIWQMTRQRRFQAGLVWLMLSGIVAGLAFLILNPAWWSDPLGRAQDVLRLRSGLLAGQIEMFEGYAGLGEQMSGFLRQTGFVLPQYYEAPWWRSYPDFMSQITAYEASLWRGISLGGSLPGAILLGVVVALGLWAVCRRPARLYEGGWLLLAWSLAVLVLTLVITPLEWQRYYLPAYPVIAVWLGLGGQTIAEWVNARRALALNDGGVR